MRSIRRSLIISFGDKYTSFILYFLSTMILSRIMTPDDIGIYSVAYGIAGMSAMLRDFGVGSYLVQEKELTERRFQSALGVVTLTATVVGVALAGAADWIADFYARPEMRYAIYILACTFAFIPFNCVILAMLRREMAFAAIYRMSTAGSFANVVTSIVFALLGSGFMCMAYGSLASSIVTSVIAFRHRPRDYRIRPQLAEWRRMAEYGVFATATQLVMELNNRAPDLIIGRLLGLEAVGLFSRANGLVTAAIQSLVRPVESVAISAFSITSREKGDLKRSYLDALCLLTSVTWPAFIFLALMAFPIIRILCGDQWDSAVPLARFTCANGMFLSLTGLQLAVFQAVGAVKRNLAVTAVVTPLQIILLLWSGQYTLHLVAIASSFTGIAMFVACQYFINGIIQTSPRDILRAVAKSFALSLLSAIPPSLALLYFCDSAEHIWSSILLAALGTAVVWLGGAFLLNHPIKTEIMLIYDKARHVSPGLFR